MSRPRTFEERQARWLAEAKERLAKSPAQQVTYTPVHTPIPTTAFSRYGGKAKRIVPNLEFQRVVTSPRQTALQDLYAELRAKVLAGEMTPEEAAQMFTTLTRKNDP